MDYDPTGLILRELSQRSQTKAEVETAMSILLSAAKETHMPMAVLYMCIVQMAWAMAMCAKPEVRYDLGLDIKLRGQEVLDGSSDFHPERGERRMIVLDDAWPMPVEDLGIQPWPQS